MTKLTDLDIRDAVAAMAMQGMLSNPNTIPGGVMTPGRLADLAFRYADAFVEVRRERDLESRAEKALEEASFPLLGALEAAKEAREEALDWTDDLVEKSKRAEIEAFVEAADIAPLDSDPENLILPGGFKP